MPPGGGPSSAAEQLAVGGEAPTRAEADGDDDFESMLSDEAVRASAGSGAPDVRGMFARLQGRVNAYEERFACVVLIEELLEALFEHYQRVFSDNEFRSVDLTTKFYAVEDTPAAIVPLPDSFEYYIESLWLGRVDTVPVQIRGAHAELKLHSSKVRDDRPLPVLLLQDEGESKPRALRVLRRSADTRHSHIIKYAPCLPGAIIDRSLATAWLENANATRGVDDTSVWPGHSLLSRLMTLWMGRSDENPLSQTTFVADMARLRVFMEAIAAHDSPRLHFACIGQERIFGYLVLTANDGDQSEIGRLPVGSALTEA